MARRLLLRHPNAPAHLIEVAVKWPRSLWTHPPSEACASPAHTTASSAEVLATYRRHRQRLADVILPERGVRPGAGDEVAALDEPSVADLFAPDLLEAATALYDPTL